MGTEESFDTVIEPGRGMKHYWAELWQYRGLFYFLAWRDILVRYKQTVIGVAWSVIKPLLTMVVLTVVFGKLARLPSGGVPYPILVFAAMLPWQMFSSTLMASSNSLVGNTNLLSKVYFPRLIVPSSTAIVSLVDFAVSFVILAGLMVWYRHAVTWRILVLPLFILLAMITALGFGYLFSALNVRYRDFRHMVPFMVQFGLYISPVGFSTQVVPENWRLAYSINPMVGVIDGFRWALLGKGFGFYLPGFLLSVAFTVFIFWLGLTYFRRLERTFADVI